MAARGGLAALELSRREPANVGQARRLAARGRALARERQFPLLLGAVSVGDTRETFLGADQPARQFTLMP
jgi:hypothetical protein